MVNPSPSTTAAAMSVAQTMSRSMVRPKSLVVLAWSPTVMAVEASMLIEPERERGGCSYEVTDARTARRRSRRRRSGRSRGRQPYRSRGGVEDHEPDDHRVMTAGGCRAGAGRRAGLLVGLALGLDLGTPASRKRRLMRAARAEATPTAARQGQERETMMAPAPTMMALTTVRRSTLPGPAVQLGKPRKHVAPLSASRRGERGHSARSPRAVRLQVPLDLGHRREDALAIQHQPHHHQHREVWK